MPSELASVILATMVISSGSLVGIATIAFNQQFLSKILLSLVSLSAGTMLAAALLHLLPESIETLGVTLPLRLTLFSFIGFFLLERFLHWRHCHDKDHLVKHTMGTMNLVADAIHNFLDGILIAASFATGAGLGLVATLAIALHEIPQEIGDFGVLLHSGFTRRRALLANLLVSLTAIMGGVLGYFASHLLTSFAHYLVPIAAGGFLYISAADLIPELRHVSSTKKTFAMIATFLFGVGIMMLVKE
ncbi:MAG: Zinc/iron permease [Microgenomates group bacterium GW2011_GWA2_46_7]|nr:MAG: Zinc/iron permease [Microgenomates group bacterium GW2011_GWA2_46_7]KKU46767.1 MAG: Zinc/iron permease [Microgenomates group bacterium GW2011_GWC2_46_7]